MAISYLTKFDPDTGNIVGHLSFEECLAEHVLAETRGANLGVVPGLHSAECGWIEHERFTAYTEDQQELKRSIPSHASVWSNTTMSWTDSRPLAEVKIQRWAAIKSERSKLSESFQHEGLSFNLNEARIDGFVTTALAAKLGGLPFSVSWIQANNAAVTLDADQMIALGRASKDCITRLWSKSQEMRAALEVATTREEVSSITWPEYKGLKNA